MSVFEQVLAVQELDTSGDQLRTLLERLPERAARQAADRAVAALGAERAALRARATGLEAEIGVAERDSASIDTHAERLNRQLKTIISPREAEALQNELASLASRRSDLDDAELAAFESLGEIEVAEADLDAREPSLVDAAAAAAAAQAEAEASIAAQLADFAERRAAAADAVPADVLGTYESMRVQHKGVAIARLHGASCGGCHVDLSRSELEAVWAAPADDAAHCPNCDRWLIR